MSTLLLRLAAPLQSWGSSSRFTVRTTEHAPTKSGVIGMLAAATGLRRTDPLEDLMGLRFGVRVDQPGRFLKDFQTASKDYRKTDSWISDRYYLSDAVFCAGVEGPEDLLLGLQDAIQHPRFPLYLGRRSCPPAGKIALGVYDGSVWEVLRDFEVRAPWLASGWYRRNQAPFVDLKTRFDAIAVPSDVSQDELISFTERDEPISFDPTYRRYGMRSVIEATLRNVPNELSQARFQSRYSFDHDPLMLLGGDNDVSLTH